jgi:hypothetical protein
VLQEATEWISLHFSALFYDHEHQFLMTANAKASLVEFGESYIPRERRIWREPFPVGLSVRDTLYRMARQIFEWGGWYFEAFFWTLMFAEANRGHCGSPDFGTVFCTSVQEAYRDDRKRNPVSHAKGEAGRPGLRGVRASSRSGYARTPIEYRTSATAGALLDSPERQRLWLFDSFLPAGKLGAIAAPAARARDSSSSRCWPTWPPAKTSSGTRAPAGPKSPFTCPARTSRTTSGRHWPSCRYAGARPSALTCA